MSFLRKFTSDPGAATRGVVTIPAVAATAARTRTNALAIIVLCVLMALATLAPSRAISGTVSSSMLSTSITNSFGAILSARRCTGPNCGAVINTCSGSDCHDITNSCVGADCTVPVYINSQVPACLQDTMSGESLGCFPAGISAIQFQPSPTGSSLVLTERGGGGQFLAKLFLSSASPPPSTMSTLSSIPALQICATAPPPADICDSATNTCTLTKSLNVTSASATNCALPYPYPLDLNGYNLQGDSNTGIFFDKTILNSAFPHPGVNDSVMVTNVTVILNNLSKPAFYFAANAGQYPALFQNVTVYNGGFGIYASNVKLGVYSSSFHHSQVGVAAVQSGNQPNRYTHIYGSDFQSTFIGLELQSDWPRDKFVTVWQENPYEQCDASGKCVQDQVYSGAAYPPDLSAPPPAPYTRTYDPLSAVYYPSGIEVIGNLFSNVSKYALNIENAKEALVVSNQVNQFAGTAFRVFKSKNPTFNSNDIESSATNYATIGIDLEYCDYQGVTRNEISATTGIATHNYGGKFRNSTGLYYNNISADVGIEGVWDQIDSMTPSGQEQWVSVMVDNETAGNNFSAYPGINSPLYTPATSFANQVAADVPSIITSGATASYPIYPYDRVVDPFARVYCGRNPAQRVNHFIPVIEESPHCNLIGQHNVGSSPTWVGNYYDGGRMSGNIVGSNGPVSGVRTPYPDLFFNIPVWTVSAPFNMCLDKTAKTQNGLSFSSYQSDYMPSVRPISYAGICNLGGSTRSLGDLLPSAQAVFPPSSVNSSNYGIYAEGVVNRTDGQDNCGFNYPRAEFPSCSAGN